MRAAIALEFPETIHRNCLFHIMSKAEKVLMGPVLTNNPKFARDLYDIIFNSLTEEEFESCGHACLMSTRCIT
jgi:hypothetical protein